MHFLSRDEETYLQRFKVTFRARCVASADKMVLKTLYNVAEMLT